MWLRGYKKTESGSGEAPLGLVWKSAVFDMCPQNSWGSGGWAGGQL